MLLKLLLDTFKYSRLRKRYDAFKYFSKSQKIVIRLPLQVLMVYVNHNQILIAQKMMSILKKKLFEQYFYVLVGMVQALDSNWSKRYSCVALGEA